MCVVSKSFRKLLKNLNNNNNNKHIRVRTDNTVAGNI